MKREKTLWLIIFFVLAVCSLWSYIVVSEWHSRKAFNARIETYLEDKYGRNVSILEYIPEYHGAPAAKVCFDDDPKMVFISYPYTDYYFITHLEEEAKEILLDCFPGYRIFTAVSWHCFNEMEIKRMMFYQKHKRPISWNDSECEEKLSRIYISKSSDFTKADADRIANTVFKVFSGSLDDSVDITINGENCKYRYRLSAEGILDTVR